MRAILIALLALLVMPAGALGGGFVTVGLSSLPEGTAPGEPWEVELSLLQHGRVEAPAEGLSPAVIVQREDGSERRSFRAAPTERAGVYRARVVFPDAGTWRYRVDDGFAGAVHSYPPVRIGGVEAAAVSGGGEPKLPLALLAAAVAGLSAAGLTRLVAAAPWRRPAEA